MVELDVDGDSCRLDPRFFEDIHNEVVFAHFFQGKGRDAKTRASAGCFCEIQVKFLLVNQFVCGRQKAQARSSLFGSLGNTASPEADNFQLNGKHSLPRLVEEIQR